MRGVFFGVGGEGGGKRGGRSERERRRFESGLFVDVCRREYVEIVVAWLICEGRR